MKDSRAGTTGDGHGNPYDKVRERRLVLHDWWRHPSGMMDTLPPLMTRGRAGLPREETAASISLPRWEWRIFAHDLSRHRALRDACVLAVDSPQMDTYLLSRRATDSVKVRDGALQIQSLLERSPDGLERWSMRYTAPFPLTATDLAVVYAAWGLTEAAPKVSRCGPDALRTQIVSRHPDLRAVDVHKQRTRIEVCGCAGEQVALLIDGAPWESLAFASTNPSLVLAAVTSLGHRAQENEPYGAALMRITAFTPADDRAGIVTRSLRS